MESIRRRNRWVGFAFALAGMILATSAFAGGCGGSESSGSPTSDDTGTPDTGAPDTTPADTNKPDTKPAPDTTVEETSYDAPGSLFDVDIPDITLDGDVSLPTCYACALEQCHDQVATCDTDPRCRGLLLCGLVDCGASTTDLACLLDCATAYGVSSPTDPVATEALGILTCAQSKCGSKCPSVSLDGGPPGDSSSSEVSSGETGVADAGSGASDASPMMHPPTMSIDPRVVQIMVDVNASFEGMPEVRAGLVDHFKSFEH